MNIIKAETNKEKRDFIKFIYHIYKDDNKYRDLNLLFVKNFLYKQDKYAKRCEVVPLIVKDGETKAVAMYIFTNDSDELKLSFLEFVPNAETYLKAIIEYGQILGKQEYKKKIVIGINGHVTYGLGILENNEGLDFEFNSNYNHNYYTQELDKLGMTKKKVISYSYSSSLDDAKRLCNPAVLKRIYDSYTFRCFNPRRFKHEMLIFGDIIDKAWRNTPYYSPKTAEELFELIDEMRLLLKKEDIIFAIKDGKEVGFVFTHPDYAELFSHKKVNLVLMFFKLFFKQPKILIYNSFGILPEYQKKGLATALLYESIRVRIANPFPEAVSSFVIEENLPSNGVCSSFSKGISREFAIYELLIRS